MNPTTKVKMSSVIISDDKIEQIKSAIAQLDHHKTIFEDWGFEDVFEKGTAVSLMFHGIPGTGKTLMAQAIADHFDMDLRILGTADIESSEPGGAERAIKEAFKIASVRMAIKNGLSSYEIQQKYEVDITNAPTELRNPITGETKPIPRDEQLTGNPQLLLFDECDSLLVDRNSVGVIIAAQINTLLSELEQFQGVVIFTTNRLGRLDPALERRIAAKIEFEFPDKKQRRAIWRRMIPLRAPIADDVSLEELSEYALVGGNIKNAVLNAARSAAYKGLKEINKECFVEAIEDEMEGLQQFVSSMEQDRNLNRVLRASGGDIGKQSGGLSRSIEKKIEKATKITKSTTGLKDSNTFSFGGNK